MKTIVVYYSKTGNNKYLAEKISANLSCDLEAIKPRIDYVKLFLRNIHLGIKPLKHKIKDYERVILCGPVWMGKLIPPLRSFIKKYHHKIDKLIFVTCCKSAYSKKDKKFGHGWVFKEVEKMLNGKCVLCQAFPVGLLLPDEKQDDPNVLMQVHLNDENFKGEIQEIYDDFIRKIT